MAITLLKCNKCCNTVPNNCLVHVSCMLTCVLHAFFMYCFQSCSPC